MLMFGLCKIDAKLAFGLYENSAKLSFGLCKKSAKLAFEFCKILQKHCRVATGLVEMPHPGTNAGIQARRGWK